jgi:8-oxo-dGTP diphosphatase
MNESIVKVGVGVMIFKEGKVLIGKRRGGTGAGAWAWPGGKLEFMESVTECAKRETREEAGIEIGNIRFLRYLNFKEDDRHYADLALVADWVSGEPKVLEPAKCEQWIWADPENLPQPVWSTIPSYLEALKTGRNYFDN